MVSRIEKIRETCLVYGASNIFLTSIYFYYSKSGVSRYPDFDFQIQIRILKWIYESIYLSIIYIGTFYIYSITLNSKATYQNVSNCYSRYLGIVVLCTICQSVVVSDLVLLVVLMNNKNLTVFW